MKPLSSRATILLLSLSSDQILAVQCNNVTHLFKGDQIVRVNSTDLSNATQVVFNFPSIFNYFQFLAIWCHCQSFSRTELWRCWRLWQGKSRWRWRGWSSSRWRSRRTRWRSRRTRWRIRRTRWRSWSTRWRRRWRRRSTRTGGDD